MNRRECISGLIGLVAAGLSPRLARSTSLFDGRDMDPMRPKKVQVAPGLDFRKVATMGDVMSADGAVFGSGADYVAAIPLDSPGRMLLWVNHSAPPARLDEVARWSFLDHMPTMDDVLDYMGASVIEVESQSNGAWKLVPNSNIAWRITGRMPDLTTTGPAASLIGKTRPGSIRNGAGAVTPWGTVISGEKDIGHHVPESPGTRDGKIGISGEVEDDRKPGATGEYHGWMMEADPRDSKWQPRLHTSLGRFRHGAAEVVAQHNRPLRVYMTDERPLGGLWRFESRDDWKKDMGRDEGSKLLTEGTLSVARFLDGQGGRWLPVELDTELRRRSRNAALWRARSFDIPVAFRETAAEAKRLSEVYKTEGALRVDAWLGGLLVGGSPLGRPQGLAQVGEALYLSLADNTGTQGTRMAPPIGVDVPSGAVVRIIDGGRRFDWSVPLRAGDQIGFPGPLARDSEEALLIATAAEPSETAAGPWGNNALYRLKPTGAVRYAVAPGPASFGQPAVSPDGKTVFCSLRTPHPLWGAPTLLCIYKDKR